MRFTGRQPVVILDRSVGLVEFAKLLGLADQIDRVLLAVAGRERAMIKAAEAFGDVADPAGLAVFAVADDVDAGLGLFAHDARDFVAQRLPVCGFVVGLAMVARRQDVADRHRANEAADMGYEDTIGAALHGL